MRGHLEKTSNTAIQSKSAIVKGTEKEAEKRFGDPVLVYFCTVMKTGKTTLAEYLVDK